MSYAYNTRTNTKSKWDTIQEDVADAYAYLDEEVEQDEDELEDELTDEQVDALLAEMAEVA
jgi:gas vesicle protein